VHLYTILGAPSHCSALASTKADRVWHRTHQARETRHALLDSSALTRHAGISQEAARDVRALLDLLRENEAAAKSMLRLCQEILQIATFQLKILDPEHGDEELINSVAAELAK